MSIASGAKRAVFIITKNAAVAMHNRFFDFKKRKVVFRSRAGML